MPTRHPPIRTECASHKEARRVASATSTRRRLPPLRGSCRCLLPHQIVGGYSSRKTLWCFDYMRRGQRQLPRTQFHLVITNESLLGRRRRDCRCVCPQVRGTSRTWILLTQRVTSQASPLTPRPQLRGTTRSWILLVIERSHQLRKERTKE